MAESTPRMYPRPDFERTGLNWTSLNGHWDFLFDNEDQGLLEGWNRTGLPEKVTIDTTGKSGESSNDDAESLTQKIAALPENLLKDNVFQKSTTIKEYEKCQIKVPFVFQCPASGLTENGAHEVIWYERNILDIRSSREKDHSHRLILKFGAVDYEATIWLNGIFVGEHRGGHVPFELDLTEAIGFSEGANEPSHRLTVRVRDSPYDLTQPRGKQYWAPKPESIFYTPSSGIWQSVWLESVPPTRIADSTHGTIIQSNDIDSGALHTKIAVTGRRSEQKCTIEVEAHIGGISVGKTSADLPKELNYMKKSLDLRLSPDKLSALPSSIVEKSPLTDEKCWLDGLALWSPDHPLLYDLTLRLYNKAGQILDEVKTLTGMRKLEWKSGDGTFRLNGKPYFQALVLDQGYWPETGITPPSPESLKTDIELSKKMGFNGCRKHQKVEDPIFLYWADKLGYLVWGEMANAYKFSDEYAERFDQEWMDSVKRDINHPSIVTWTPVNESWGYPSLKSSVEERNHIRSLYYMTKTLDPTRSINDNCGWEHVCTDLTTFHDYNDYPDLTKTCSTLEGILDTKAGRQVFVGPISGLDNGLGHTAGAPVICTEFGGINIAPAEGGTAAGERDWGYTTASDPQDLLKRVENLVMGIVRGGHCCGFVYTQLTDIEQEVNGLYSFDRREKLDATQVKRIMDAAQKAYYEQLN